MNKWIPVTERLPEGNAEYIITTVSFHPFEFHVYTSDFCPENGWSNEDSVMTVIAWQELPEPYKGESHGQR